ncbi:MAG: pyridoxal phosphate-dependent aminotransferase, partial [Planctomycetia bacterium]|nr:pyridoxal phosphate-dependent aminotransferase [Planctomycetia bacterium]
VFELLFAMAFLDSGDGVLVFCPYFPTYLPNIAARGARAWVADLKQEHDFRPDLADVERFLREDSRPRAIFLNSPHNPTGGVATEDDLAGIARLIRGRDVIVFSDEPYNHMVWRGKHRSLLQQPEMLSQCVSAYTFSKSYSMSGWRLGFAVSSRENAEAIAKVINVTLSCVPPLVQLAGAAALCHDTGERDSQMAQFAERVRALTAGLNRIDGVKCLEPAATFYAFPNVKAVCNRLGITSHGLALYLLEGADDRVGVACLGGECFGPAGAGFLRLSCAERYDRLQQAISFMGDALSRVERVGRYLETQPQYRLAAPYAV